MSDALMVCAVFAHPDDEAFGVSGTLAKLAADGVRTALICATRGEAGLSNCLASSPEALAGVRTAELACAGQAMGLSELEVFDFPDGLGNDWDLSALAARLEDALRRIEADVVITFDASGVTKHADHIAVHKATRDLVAQRGQSLGIRRLFYQVVTCPEEAQPDGPALTCVTPDEVDVTVNIREFERIKRVALGCHRTQAADTVHLLDLPDGSLTAEHYVLGWTDDDWQPVSGADDLLAGIGAGRRGLG